MPNQCHEGHGSEPQRTRADARRALINASLHLISQGRHSASITDITERAGVSPGAFYNHFTNKDELFKAAMVEVVDELAHELQQFTAEMSDPAEILSASLRLLVRLQRKTPEMFKVLLQCGTALMFRPNALVPLAEQLVSRGHKDGRFPVADPTMATYAGGGALLGVLQMLESTPSADADALSDAFACHMLYSFGIEWDEAIEVSTRPLPTLPTSVFRLEPTW